MEVAVSEPCDVIRVHINILSFIKCAYSLYSKNRSTTTHRVGLRSRTSLPETRDHMEQWLWGEGDTVSCTDQWWTVHETKDSGRWRNTSRTPALIKTGSHGAGWIVDPEIIPRPRAEGARVQVNHRHTQFNSTLPRRPAKLILFFARSTQFFVLKRVAWHSHDWEDRRRIVFVICINIQLSGDSKSDFNCNLYPHRVCNRWRGWRCNMV